MFDPKTPNAIEGLFYEDLNALPPEEDDFHEYKSSKTKDDDLAKKLSFAASAFANSGGGLFVVGVNCQGKPDGGIPLHVGRQPRRDWIDLLLHRVQPIPSYFVRTIEGPSPDGVIGAGRCVLLVAFPESQNAPHMASDLHYYVRSGAHTFKANHYLVEAIRSRQRERRPVLRHVVRYKPGNSGIIQVGLITLNDVAALDVRIDITSETPAPSYWEHARAKPLCIPVISAQFPLFFDVHHLTISNDPLPVFDLTASFRNNLGEMQSCTFKVDLNNQLGFSVGENRDLKAGLNEIAQAVKSIVGKR